MKNILAFSLVAISLSFAACSSLVDPLPASPEPVMHVQDYYLPLNEVGASFSYCRKSSYGIDTILLTMRGIDDMSSIQGKNMQCYHTDMRNASRYLNNFFYVMNDSEAFTLGNVSCFGTNQSWLDLKAPLLVGQTWTFNNSSGSFYVNRTFTATVTHRGVKMKMPDGRIFDDVAEVTYVSTGGDSTVKWFAKGSGLIYSTSKNPDSDFGQEMRLLR